jgi:hypothetical protein
MQSCIRDLIEAQLRKVSVWSHSNLWRYACGDQYFSDTVSLKITQTVKDVEVGLEPALTFYDFDRYLHFH